jgi:hypothetical protein
MLHENFPIAETEQDHKMDKKLKITEIARHQPVDQHRFPRAGGKANTSETARRWYWNVRVS